MKRNNLSLREEAQRRVDAQMPQEEKMKYANIT
jgi:dephospho-CoA kinase